MTPCGEMEPDTGILVLVGKKATEILNILLALQGALLQKGDDELAPLLWERGGEGEVERKAARYHIPELGIRRTHIQILP